MDYQLRRLDHVPVYSGKIMTVYQDTMELPDGHLEKWDFIEHRYSGAAIVAELPDGRVLLVRQYRPAIGKETLELPAGAREKDESGALEDSKLTAARELREETGYVAGSLEKMVRVYSSPAYNDEFTDVYLARDLQKAGGLLLDAAEEITVEALTRQEVRERIFAGEITDSKTIAGVLAWLTI